MFMGQHYGMACLDASSLAAPAQRLIRVLCTKVTLFPELSFASLVSGLHVCRLASTSGVALSSWDASASTQSLETSTWASWTSCSRSLV